MATKSMWSKSEKYPHSHDLPPENSAILNWNFPLMIPDRDQGEFHESKQVHRGAERLRFEASGRRRRDRG
jgi:hypothetical protein